MPRVRRFITAGSTVLPGASLLLSVVWLLAGCPAQSSFACATHVACDLEPGGVCQPGGQCSYPDPDCASMLRLVDAAGNGLGCVDAEAPSTTSSGSGESGETTSGGTTAATIGVVDGSDGTTTDTTGGSSGSTAGDSATGCASEEDGSQPCCTVWSDDFEDGAIDPAWSVGIPAEITEADGELKYLLSPDDGPEPRLSSTQAVDLVGGWARAHIGSTSPDERIHQLLRIDNGPPAGALAFMVEGDQLVVRMDPPGPDYMNHTELSFDADLHHWLQIRLEEDLAVFEVSANGIEFAPIAGVDLEIPFTTSTIELVANNWDTIEAPVEVSFRAVAMCSQG